jgi:biotin transport system permease protein
VTGLYLPGTSALHRAPAGTKLLGLAVATTLLVALRSPWAVGAGAVLAVGGYALARFRPAVLLAQVRPLRWVVVALVPFQWWQGGPRAVTVIVGTMLVTVAAAALVTLTTRVLDLLDVVERAAAPLRHLGLRPDRLALLIALTLRAVPVLAATFDDVRDARRARGLEHSPRALLVPLVVRTLRHADRLGEALVARGVDD